MDRNTLLGVILIGIALIIYSYYNQRQAEQVREREATEQDDSPVQSPHVYEDSPYEQDQAVARESQDPLEDTLDVDQSIQDDLFLSQFGPFAHAARGEEKFLTVENEHLVIVFSSKGGQVHSVELKDYKTSDGDPLILFEGYQEHHIDYQFFLPNNRDIHTAELFFETESSSVVVSGDQSKSVSFVLSAGEGRYMEKRYTIDGSGYDVGYELKLVGFDEIIPRNNAYLSLSWERIIRRLENHYETEKRYTTVFYRYANEDVEYLSDSRTAQANFSSTVQWVSYKQQFFNSTLINLDGFYRGSTESEEIGGDQIRRMKSNLILTFNQEQEVVYDMQFYFGPNHFQSLRAKELGMENLVDIGKGFMAWVKFINRISIIPIFNWLNNYFVNYGLIIFLLTLIIKMVLFPLTYKSYMSMAKMKVLKPELDELREKYKEDQQKFGAEQLKLFQRAGVNPLGGCLPMLLQMPILISMYYFFPASIELRQESFLWATDLSTYDSIMSLPFNVPFYGSHVSLFTLLMAVSAILFAVTNSQMSGTAHGPMKYMPYIFPVFLIFIFNSFPAALTYYYFLFNLISFSQQMIIKKFFINEDAIHKKIQENKKKPAKKSAFQRKLEDITKQQQALKKEKTSKSKSKKKN